MQSYVTVSSLTDLISIKNNMTGVGALVVQLIKHPALDFGSGHDLTVCGFEPQIGLCADGAEPA